MFHRVLSQLWLCSIVCKVSCGYVPSCAKSAVVMSHRVQSQLWMFHRVQSQLWICSIVCKVTNIMVCWKGSNDNAGQGRAVRGGGESANGNYNSFSCFCLWSICVQCVCVCLCVSVCL